MKMNMHIWGWQIDGQKKRKKRRRENRNLEWETESTGKTGACAVSFDKGPLQCYQIEASEWSVSHTNTSSLSVCLFLFPLVSFPSADQPLADRTGPLGSCYRPPQQRLKSTDSCSEVPTVPGKSLRISHWIPYLRQKEEEREGSREWAEMENERQVRHLVRVKEGKQEDKEEEKAEREWQRLSKLEKNAERDKRKMKCESLSYCLPAVYQGRQ